jgi:hypothetical protein
LSFILLIFDPNQNGCYLIKGKENETIPPFSDRLKNWNSKLVKKSCHEQLMKLKIEKVRRNVPPVPEKLFLGEGTPFG